MRLIDSDALVNPLKLQADSFRRIGEWVRADALDDRIVEIGEQPTVDAEPVVRCRECKHKKLDGPSICKSIVNEFYCDEKLGWRYQYEGEPDILDWFCADGERADAPKCGPDYCEIGGDDDAR